MLCGFRTQLRKQAEILRWIELEREQARVIWRSEDLGTWDEIRAGWAPVRGRIKIHFEYLGRRAEHWLTALRTSAEGIRMILAEAGFAEGRELIVLLGRSRHECVPREPLMDIALAWLRRQVAGARIEFAARHTDRGNTLSGSLLRIHARQGGRDHIILVAPPGRGGDCADEVLTQGCVWVAALRSSRRLEARPRMALLVPADRSAVVSHRARWLDRNACSAAVWEYDPDNPGIEAWPAPPPVAPREHLDFRWPLLGPHLISEPLARILDLAPGAIRRYPRFHEYDSLRLFGLEFARAEGAQRDRIVFGIGTQRSELGIENFDSLQALVAEILYFRRPDSPDPHHPLYRAQAERWLESLLLDDCERLFPELIPGSVYSQIPVYLGDRQGRVDILGADKDGTLVVMELKVSEDPGLPLQALDYWGRVIRHNEAADFERRGYFSQARLSRNRPRIYLVAPVFSYHDTTEKVLGFVDPRVEVWKVPVNVDWRCGVKILGRTCLKRGR